MRFGIDYVGTLSPTAHKAVGSTFACRYLRELTGGEVKTLRASGIDVVVAYERDATRALGGEKQGIFDGREGLAQAEACGIPKGRPIYFAVDFPETAAQAGAVAAYFKGINSVLGVARTGAYGSFDTIGRLFAIGRIRYAWQTYAWSAGKLDHRACLYQYSNDHTVAGHGCDFDHSLAADFGQWGFQQPVPKPASHPTGMAYAKVGYDTKNGNWSLEPLPGSFKPGGPDHNAAAEIEFNPSSGKWRGPRGEAFNAAPLGKG